MNARLLRLTAAIAVLSAVTLLAPVSVNAEVRALVIGVDNYQHVAKLKGAVNDARLISESLRASGATRVVTLLDEQATSSRVWREWNALQSDAPDGSVLVFAYAGHGVQRLEQVKDDEDDGLDEVIALAGYDHSLPLPSQRDWVIVDNEWRSWVANARRHRVVTLFDTCNSGTLTRAVIDPSALPVRMIPRGVDELPVFQPLTFLGVSPWAGKEPSLLANEIYVGGTSDGNTVPEVSIDGKAHGALSFYFARALRSGGADTSHDTLLSVGELRNYLMERVESLTNAQLPVIRYAMGNDEPVFKLDARMGTSTRLPSLPDVPIDYVEAPPTIRMVLQNEKGVRPAIATDVAVLRYRSTPVPGLYTSLQLLALSLESNSPDRAALAGAVRKWRMVDALRSMQEGRVLELKPINGVGPFSYGSCGRGSDLPGPHCFVVRPDEMSEKAVRVAFNLTSDGLLQALCLTGDRCQTYNPKAGTYSFEARQPAGSDHLVVVEMQDAAPFTAWLMSRNQQSLDDSGELLVELGRQKIVRIGIAALYTCNPAAHTCGEAGH